MREDVLALYGFSTALEERLFEKLISVAGVGPALALKAMSGLEPGALVDAIRTGDLRRLSSIPGVGKKTAERLVVELLVPAARFVDAETTRIGVGQYAMMYSVAATPSGQ